MLERRRGHVVNISSGLGYFLRPTEPAYATTKAAALALSRALRADCRRNGVAVSAICPGVISTGIIEAARFLGQRNDPAVVTHAKRLFGDRGHPPSAVTKAIVGAVLHDRGVVPVGVDARIGWALQRVLPVDALGALAAAELDRV